MTQNRGWNLDRNLSAGLIIAVLFQAGSFIWYGGKLDSRVIAVEEANKVAITSQKTLEGKIDGNRSGSGNSNHAAACSF